MISAENARRERARARLAEALKDFEWWSKTLWRIRPNERKRDYIPFVFKNIQKQVWKNWGQKNVVPKPRRIGLSTFGISRTAHVTMTEPNLDSLVVGNQKDVAMNLLDILNRGYSAMPESVTVTEGGSKFEFPCKPEIKNESRMQFRAVHDWTAKRPKMVSLVTIATAKGEHAVGRSLSIGNLLITEAGMPEYWDGQAFYSAIQGLPSDESGEVTCEGSPFGAQGWFYKLVKAAQHKQNEYVYHWHTWLEHEDYVRKPRPGDVLQPVNDFEYELVHKYGVNVEQLLWARHRVENYFGEGKSDPFKLFHQEFPIDEYQCWLRQGRGYFPAEVITWGLGRAVNMHKLLDAAGRVKRYRLQYVAASGEQPRLVEDKYGPWTFIEDPVPGYPYLVTADPAEGLEEGNESAALVWKPSSLGPHRCIGYMNRQIAVEDFEANLFAVGMRFNEALLMVEANNHGKAVNVLLNRDGYSNLYRMNAHSKGSLTSRSDMRHGFWSGNTTGGQTSKHIALGIFTRGIYDAYTSKGFKYDSLEIPFPEVWEQLRAFSHLSGQKLGGAESPDDLVSCCWMGGYELLEGRAVTPPRNDMVRSDLYLQPGDSIPPACIEQAFPEIEPRFRRRRWS